MVGSTLCPSPDRQFLHAAEGVGVTSPLTPLLSPVSVIELTLLGSTMLRRLGEPAEGLLVQPRRLALLSYLAASNGAFQRRDRLLLLFWGEQPEARARASLRQALYFIRRTLGDDVFLARGDEEVGLNPAAIRVDVTELERALSDGHAERALALYRGDFLADFNIDGAPEFERWATDRRRELRRSVVGAAWELADGSLAAGSQDQAMRWARRAVDLAEYAEHDVRRAMRTIAAAGNRSAALEMYETLRERLAADHGTGPETETTSLANELRAPAGSSELVGIGASAPPSLMPEVERPRSDSPVLPALRPQLPSFARVALAVVIVSVLAGIAVTTRRASASTDASIANRVAVFPFTVRSRLNQSGYLRDGVATLLGLALDGAGRLRIVDPNAALSASSPTVDLDAARGVASTLGAGQFVLGEIEESGARLNITATLYDIQGRTQVRATATGDEGRLFDLVDSLARRLAVSAMTDSTARLASAAATSTRSLAAFKAFLAGEASMHAGHYREAAAALQEAVAADSSFGLAYYRLSLVREWTDGEISSDSANALAEHFSSHLPDRDRKLLAARRAFVRQDGASGERLVRGVLATYPTDADAWAQLGEILFHLGPDVGRDIDEAREPFLTVLRYRPNDLSARVHLTRIAARNGDLVHLDEWSGPYVSLGDASEIGTFELAAMRATVLGDVRARDAMASAIQRANDVTVLSTMWRLATYSGDPDAAVDMASSPRANAFESRDVLLAYRIAAGHLGGADLPTDSLARLRASLIAAMLALPSAPDMPAVASQSHEELRRLLALAGAPSTALAAATRILEARYPASLSPLKDLPTLSDDDERTTRAMVGAIHALATDPARTLDLLAPTHGAGPASTNGMFHDIAASTRAEALHRLGRDSEAIGWLRSIGMSSGALSTDIAFAVRRIAELEEGRGAHVVAARERLRFRRMWRTCDADLRPLVDAASSPPERQR